MSEPYIRVSDGATELWVGVENVPTAAEISTQVWGDAPEIASPINVTGVRDTILAAIAAGVTLTTSERDAVSFAVEAALLNEGDGQQLINAIVQSIGSENITAATIAAAVWSSVSRTLTEDAFKTVINYGDGVMVINSTPTLSLNSECLQNHRIVRYRGDTYPVAIQVVDESGAGQDITGNVVSFTCDAPGFIAITGVLTDALNGLVEFSFSSDNADNAGRYEFNIGMSGLDTRTLAAGDIEFR